MVSNCKSVIKDIEESIDLTDLLMKYVMMLADNSSASAGVKFQAYRVLTDLREKIVSVRMGLVNICYCDN